MIDQPLGTGVIGRNQAGSTVGYFPKKRDLPFVILDENERIGEHIVDHIVSTRLSREDAGAGATTAGRQYA